MKLSPLQIKSLIAEARKAFAYLGAQARARGEEWDDSKEAFDRWRHREVFAACGRHGLSQATNDDFNLIKARFLTLRGEDGKSMEQLLKAGTDKQRQIRHSINSVLASGGLPDEYGHSIALDKWGVPMDDLNEKQLLQLVMTLRSRVRARSKKSAAPSNPCPSVSIRGSESNSPF